MASQDPLRRGRASSGGLRRGSHRRVQVTGGATVCRAAIASRRRRRNEFSEDESRGRKNRGRRARQSRIRTPGRENRIDAGAAQQKIVPPLRANRPRPGASPRSTTRSAAAQEAIRSRASSWIRGLGRNLADASAPKTTVNATHSDRSGPCARKSPAPTQIGRRGRTGGGRRDIRGAHVDDRPGLPALDRPRQKRGLESGHPFGRTPWPSTAWRRAC